MSSQPIAYNSSYNEHFMEDPRRNLQRRQLQAPTPDETEQYEHNRNYQEDVDETAHCVRGHQPKDPKYHQYYRN